MFVGASGVGRVIQRTAELMKEFNTSDVAPHGGVNLDTIQRYINFHFSVSLDLFGSERSTNAANYFASGLKGRFAEGDHDDDHVLDRTEASYVSVEDDDLVEETVTARKIVNADLRNDYAEDCAKGVRRWNRTLEEQGVDFEMRLPHVGFHRDVGAFRDHHVSPDGRVVSESEWEDSVGGWLPSDDERAHVASLMVRQHEVGKMAAWIAPPAAGINTKPVDFEYVKL